MGTAGSAMRKITRLVLSLAGAMALPPLALMGYLNVTRSIGLNFNWDYLALAICLGIGVAFIMLLPWKRSFRIGLGVLYLPLMAFALFILALNYVCQVFGDCV
jgi:hypothetical protein